ncbi:MAG TPA: hypothetical protein VMW24_26820 [Sedimentisphaerales bacterium]|nr:hypothetical protein [Sedimentisphaerales bacterium]
MRKTYVYLRTIRELHRQSDHEQTGRCGLLFDYSARPAMHWPSNAESKRKAEQVFWGLLG